MIADKSFALNPDLHVTSQTPPTFLLQAEDDHVDNVHDSLAYYVALKKAGVPVEMRLYAQGGHGFGLRRTKFPITGWPQLVETWLGTIGMFSEQDPACPTGQSNNSLFRDGEDAIGGYVA
jgi:acetyl esterase/lipase